MAFQLFSKGALPAVVCQLDEQVWIVTLQERVHNVSETWLEVNVMFVNQAQLIFKPPIHMVAVVVSLFFALPGRVNAQKKIYSKHQEFFFIKFKCYSDVKTLSYRAWGKFTFLLSKL